MLIGIISDIHGNLYALKEVMKAIEEHSVDELWCTGDLVGYYTFPSEVISLLTMNYTPYMVKGNHDQAAATGIIPSYFTYNAALCAYWTSRKLSLSERRILYSLPIMLMRQIEDKKILLIHGGIEYPFDEYIGSVKDDYRNYTKFMETVGIDYLITGHTHIPFTYSHHKKTIINAGSVGQPRDHDNRASYTLFDTEDDSVINHRVQYDPHEVVEGIWENNLPAEMTQRLLKGV